MGIKAASTVTPYVAGTSNFTPTDAPSVPAGYTRYVTNIATADVSSPYSLFYLATIVDETLVDLVNSLTPIIVGGYLTGYVLSETSPIVSNVHMFNPETGAITIEEFTYSHLPLVGSLIGSASLNLSMTCGI